MLQGHRAPGRLLRSPGCDGVVWLAARAVVGVPGVDVDSLHTADHSLPAAAARPPSPLVHPVLPAAGQLPGGGLLWAVGVRQQKPPSQGHHGVGVDVVDRDPGRYPQQEAHLRLIQVADPDQHWISTHYLTCVNTTNVARSNPPNNHSGAVLSLPLRPSSQSAKSHSLWGFPLVRLCIAGTAPKV